MWFFWLCFWLPSRIHKLIQKMYKTDMMHNMWHFDRKRRVLFLCAFISRFGETLSWVEKFYFSSPFPFLFRMLNKVCCDEAVYFGLNHSSEWALITQFNGLVWSGRGLCSAEGYIIPVKMSYWTNKKWNMERSKRVNRKIPTAFARVFALSSDVIVGVQGIFKIKVPQIYQPKK